MISANDSDSSAKRREIQSIHKAFQVLECVVAHPEGISLANVSRETEMNRNTVFQILNTLCTCGYLMQDKQSRDYFTGSRMLWLCNTGSTYSHLLSLARPILSELAKKTGETAHLAILDGVWARFLDKVDSTQPLAVVTNPAVPVEVHVTSVGKAILSCLPKHYLSELLKRICFTAHTPNTICSAEELLAELEVIRSTGYATDDEEFYPGVRCAAAPVKDPSGNVLCAIGVSAPAIRMPRFQETGELVLEAAQKLEEALTGK